MKTFSATASGKIVIGILVAVAVAGGSYGVYRAVQAESVPIPEVTTEAATTEIRIIRQHAIRNIIDLTGKTADGETLTATFVPIDSPQPNLLRWEYRGPELNVTGGESFVVQYPVGTSTIYADYLIFSTLRTSEASIIIDGTIYEQLWLNEYDFLYTIPQ